MRPPAAEPPSMATGDDLAAAEDGIELPGEPGGGQRVDEPGLHRAGEEVKPSPMSTDATAHSQNAASTPQSRT